MTIKESLDTRVLRVGGFGIAAFVLGVLLTGFVRGEQPQPAPATACHEGKASQGQSLARAPRSGANVAAGATCS
jgi:hypothetical protein